MDDKLVEELRELADCDARAGEPLGKCMRRAADRLEALQTALTTEREARLRAESERDALLEVMRAVFPGWYEDYINNRPSRLTAPATDEDVERGARAIDRAALNAGVVLNDQIYVFARAAIEAYQKKP